MRMKPKNSKKDGNVNTSRPEVKVQILTREIRFYITVLGSKLITSPGIENEI